MDYLNTKIIQQANVLVKLAKEEATKEQREKNLKKMVLDMNLDTMGISETTLHRMAEKLIAMGWKKS